jgi:cysteine desulfurase / selenocysteine lyase
LLNVESIRKDFPILQNNVVYLDSASSALTPEPVLQKMLEFYREYRANVGRGQYAFSHRATHEYEEARQKVAEFIGAQSKNEIIFTRNTTEGINIVANGLKWQPDDEIVTSLIEHHSNFIVWLRVKQRHGSELKVVEPRASAANGSLDPADFGKIINDKTKLVAIAHVSNVLGTVEPVEEIVQIAHEHGAYVLLDGAQSVPHTKVDVQKIGCDFMAFSGHKMCAPTGIGALYIRQDLFDQVEPSYIGGGTIADVSVCDYTLDNGISRFEAGTPAIAQAIGLGAAVDYLNKAGMDNIERHEKKLSHQMSRELEQINGVTAYGIEHEGRVALQCFNVDNIRPLDLTLELERSAGIMVRAGHLCALPLIKSLVGRTGTVRASAYLYNTEQEIEKLVRQVELIAQR